MENLEEEHRRAVKEARQLQLIESLSAWRNSEKADVTFICGGKEFPAHKLVLASSYPFFGNLFNRIPGAQITANDMKPEILEIILDYAYSGDVAKINTEEFAKEVLRVSREIQIKELIHHCCFVLKRFVSDKNALELWDIAVTCENGNLKTKVMGFLLLNLRNTVQSSEFLQFSFDRLKDFVIFVKSKYVLMDDLLSGVVQWILYDLETREKLAKSLFACIDSTLISQKLIDSLCVDKYILQSSPEVFQELTKLHHEKYTTGILLQQY